MARKATKADKELTLEQVLWNCRVALRGVGSMEKNRDAVISLVFLKFAGDKFEARRAEIIDEFGDVPAFLEKASFYNSKNVFYLPEVSRWSYLLRNASSNDIAVKIDTAMDEAQKANPSLAGALPLGLFATLGATGSSIKTLIDEISKISPERFHEEDLIGRVYEYFLQTFAVGSSKDSIHPPALSNSLRSLSSPTRALSTIHVADLAACLFNLTNSWKSITEIAMRFPLLDRSQTPILGACAR